jgi:(p)ppGpp synthase/HD superfamily hydrolase
MPETPRIEAAAQRSQLVRNALKTARVAHAGQVRNGSGGMAYIEHPKAVAELLAGYGFDEEVLATALLHDVVEDSEITVGQLEALFGPEVAQMVEALSDDESIESYRDRKDEHRQRVVDADGDLLAVYAADKLTNIVTLRRAHDEHGESVRSEFNVPLDLKLDAWSGDVAMLGHEAPELPFLAALEAELSALRDALAVSAPQPGS